MTRAAAKTPPKDDIRSLSRMLAAGKLAPAIEQCQQLLAVYEGDPDILSIQGIARYRLGDTHAATRSWLAALASNEAHFDANNNLGIAYRKAGDLPAAITHLTKAHHASPGLLEVCQNLAGCHQQQGDLRKALRVMKQSLPQVANKLPLLRQLVNVALEIDDKKNAEKYLYELLELEQNSASANHTLGSLLSQQSRFLEAAPYLEKAIELEPGNSAFHTTLGRVYSYTGRDQDAEQSYSRAIELNSDNYAAERSLGALAVYRGDREAAIKIYSGIVEKRPRCAASHLSLSLNKSFEPGDPHIDAMEALAGEGSLDDDAQGRIHFALFNAWDGVGDIDRAFSHLEKGNSLRSRLMPYSASGTEKVKNDLMECFAGSVEPLQCSSHRPRPVFVVGMPRSGTSLTEQILSAHSGVYGAGELSALTHLARQARARGGVPAEALETLRRGYLEEIDRLGISDPVVVDKMPTNFWWLGYVFNALPEAQVILIERHPVATCWSVYKTFFAEPGHGYSYDLERLVHYYQCFRELTRFWAERYPGRIYTLNYEALTESPEPQIRQMLAYLNLDFEPNCLDFKESSRLVTTASAMQVRKGIYKGSSDAWKRYEGKLARLVEALGPRP